jgi:hypothetical protein
MGTSFTCIAVLGKGEPPQSPDARLRFDPPSGWRVYTPLDRFARPTAVEKIASALVRGPNTLAVVGFVEDSDWAYIAGITPEGVVARFIIHPEGAEDYVEGQEVLSLASADRAAEADRLAMLAGLAGRDGLTAERLLDVAEVDSPFAEEPLFALLEEFGIEVPDDLS